MHAELKFAGRSLAKSPGFALVAVLSLALGIGANTAIFSLVNGILLSSLPVPHPQELRVLQWSGLGAKTSYFTGSMQTTGGAARTTGALTYAGNTSAEKRTTADSFTHPQFQLLRGECAALAEIFGYANLYNITARVGPESFTAEGLMVSANFFPGLGTGAQLGRLLGPEDAGAAPVAVVSHGWWEKHHGLDPAVLGAPVAFNGHAFTIVGVLPRGFRGVHPGDGVEFYVPMSAQPLLMPSWPATSQEHWWVKLLARVRPGTDDAQLQAALDVDFARAATSVMKEPAVVVRDGRAGPGGDRNYYRKPLLLLLGVVGVVILVACANLAGLSLARAAAREHELAVRAALGAGRWRLVRQSLVESSLLALAGGGLGLLLAFWGRSALAWLLTGAPDGLRYDVAMDWRVMGFTFGVILLTALLSGLLPALRAGRADPLAGLKSATGHASPRLRTGRFLVAAQLALSLLLVTGAGLYGRTLVNLVRINPGFATENLLLFQVTPRGAGYRGAQLAAFYDRVQAALAAIPAVRAVALTQFRLLSGTMSGGSFFSLPSHPELKEKQPSAHRLTVSETFFATMEIPVRQGRGFTAADADGALKVVVVNENFVRQYLPGENPVGQILRADNADWQIVGVCRDVRYAEIRQTAPPTVYFSFRQNSLGIANFAVRTSLPPVAVAAAARRAVAAIDPNVPLAGITTQAQVVGRSISQETMFATLVGALAGLALLLACIGLYGLMAFSVTRRTGEIGVRMALGATGRDIAWPIMREALWLAGAGLTAGLPVVLGLVRFIKSQLFGVSPVDPLVLAAGAGLLVTVALLAAWLPARRAARVNPLAALRAE